MKAVIDTNVFISGVFFQGPPSEVLNAWRKGKLSLVLSPEMLEEYERVGEKLGAQFPGVDLEPWIELLMMKAHLIKAPSLPEPVSSDPDDDKFIACALASGARIICSGDNHLLSVSGHKGIKVLKPKDFVTQFLRKS